MKTTLRGRIAALVSLPFVVIGFTGYGIYVASQWIGRWIFDVIEGKEHD